MGTTPGTRTTRGRALGLAALVAAAIALVLVLGGSDGRSYEVTAVFDQVNGLIEGADVTAGGIAVGQVESIALDRRGLPRVRMRVDDDVVLRRGATARVRPVSVSGEVSRTVDLRGGSGPKLADGAVIPRDRTGAVREFDQVLSTLDPRTRGDVRRVLARFDKATAERGPEIERTLARSADALGATAELAAQLNSDRAALRTLVREGGRVVGAVERDSGSLGGFADRLSGLFRTTAARQRELEATVESAPSGLRAARQALERLDASVDDLRELVRSARPGVRDLRVVAPELRALFSDGRPAVREARRLVDSAPADLRGIGPLLRTARPALAELTPALRDSAPILNQARVRLPDAFGFFTHWADFSANYDANGHGARVGLVFTDPPRKLREPDDSGPGEVKAPFTRDPGALQGQPWREFAESFVGVEE